MHSPNRPLKRHGFAGLLTFWPHNISNYLFSNHCFSEEHLRKHSYYCFYYRYLGTQNICLKFYVHLLSRGVYLKVPLIKH